MTISEACQVWIEQRVEEELEEGKSYRAIGREIAAEIERVFQAKVNPETIRKRAERKGGTNVPSQATPEDHEGNVEKSSEPSAKEEKPMCACGRHHLSYDNKHRKNGTRGFLSKCWKCRAEQTAINKSEKLAASLAPATEEIPGQLEHWIIVEERMRTLLDYMGEYCCLPAPSVNGTLRARIQGHLSSLNAAIRDM